MSPLIISLKVASYATIITFVLGLLAARLVVSMKYGKSFMDCLFSLPLVLPPTVVGFFLLIIFGRNGTLGQMLDSIGVSVVFDIKGAIISSVIVSFPLMYRTVRGAFEQIDKTYVYAARTVGMSEWKIFRKIIIPLSYPGILAGTVLTFARALGEFGATIMLAGNIPGKTQTISVAIYTAVQGGNRELAYKWTGVIMIISFVSILAMNYFTHLANNRGKR